MKDRKAPYPRVSRTAGFTLTELLIVMGILIALMAVVLVGVISATDPQKARVKADLMMLAAAVEAYREAYGMVLPPGYYFDPDTRQMEPPKNEVKQRELAEIESRINCRPSPANNEEKSGALLFYFLTHNFFSLKETEPGVVGRTGGERGGAIRRGNLKSDMLKDPSVLDEEFEKVDMDAGYSGVTTWFLDPWRNPYRYRLKNDGQDFEIESAGPDGKFGDQDDSEASKLARRDNISLESLNR